MQHNGDWALDVEEDEELNYEPFDDDGRVKFSGKKLYGRYRELERLDAIYKRLCPDFDAKRTKIQDDSHDDLKKNSSTSHLGTQTQVVFLAGYSGSGKTALINEFVQKKIAKKPNTSMLVTGKYAQSRSHYPYSAITNAFRQWCKNLSKNDVQMLRDRRTEMQQTMEEEDLQLLFELMPSLLRIFGNNETDVESISGTSVNSIATISIAGKQGEDYGTKKGKIKHAFQCCLKSLCSICYEYPLIIFIDDLQWADLASLELLSTLLSDETVKNLMFIGAYRSNEAGKDHPLTALITELEKEEHIAVDQMQLSDLSQNDVCEFLKDTFDTSTEKTLPLTKALYTKVLGNPFCIMQAIDQLVLKNAIYHDMITFTWNWTLLNEDDDKLEDLLSNDVIEMVKFKMQHLPRIIRKVLIFAAFTRSTFDSETLQYLLSSAGYFISDKHLLRILKDAVMMGLLLNITGSNEKEYKFSHDRIQEAATSFMLKEESDQLRMKVGKALEKLGMDTDEEWMLFTAVNHLNSVNSLLDDKLDLVRLNLLTAKISIGKASFDSAVVLLRVGVDCLDKESRWKEHYDLTLELFNLLLEIEFSTGNHPGSQAAVDEVLLNAKTLQEKELAHYYLVELITQNENRDHVLAMEKSSSIIRQYGIEIPNDDCNESDLGKEECRLKAVIKKHKLSDIVNMPLMEDSMLIALMAQLTGNWFLMGKTMQAKIVAMIAIRLCATKGLSKDLPYMLAFYASLSIGKKNRKEAIRFGNVAREMLNNSPLFKGAQWVKCMGLLDAFISPLHRPFKDSHNILLEIYSQGLRYNELTWGFIGSYSYLWNYLTSGIHLDALLESKTIIFEKSALKLSRPPSVIVLFQIFRQTIFNLQYESKDPLLLDGNACTEEEVLDRFDPDSPNYKQTRRDISVLRLMLACIFGSLPTIREMIDRLEEFGLGGNVPVGQHLRLLFVGLGALILARNNDKDKNKYLMLGTDIIKHFQKPVRIGLMNAMPVYLCLFAEKNPSKKNYDKAIDACTSAGMLHLKAMMNEHCALLQLKRKKGKEVGESYLTEAFFAYKDWGAVSKTRQLEQQYDFLKDIDRIEKRKSKCVLWC